MVDIPESHRDLLDKPLLTHLATVRPDGAAQSNPMWFAWDGEFVRFTCTTTRQKHRNVVANPEVAFSIADPENVFRYLEVRGTVEKIDPDPEGAFFMELAARYAAPFSEPPADSPKRVVFLVRPTAVSCQ